MRPTPSDPSLVCNDLGSSGQCVRPIRCSNPLRSGHAAGGMDLGGVYGKRSMQCLNLCPGAHVRKPVATTNRHVQHDSSSCTHRVLPETTWSTVALLQRLVRLSSSSRGSRDNSSQRQAFWGPWLSASLRRVVLVQSHVYSTTILMCMWWPGHTILQRAGMGLPCKVSLAV